MKTNVYLDCGGHHGEGLREFIDMYNIDDSWVVETFEPNPECNYSERISNIALDVTIHEKAVWVFDGIISFSQENHVSSKSKSPTDGKSDIDGWGSVITELSSTHLKHTDEPIEVPCVDFHRVLDKYSKDKYNVIVKMDIEGAEYSVLRHIISQGSAKNINKLYVEWHHVDFDYEDINTTRKITKQLQDVGVCVLNWK